MAYWHCPRRIRSGFYESVRCPSVHLSQHGPTAGGLLLWAHAGTAGRTSIDCCSGGCGQCHVVSVRSSRTQTCRIWHGTERSGSSLSLSTICVTRWLLAGSVARPAATAPSTPALSCHTEGPKRTLAADVHLCCPAVSHEYPRPRLCLISISSSIGDRQQRRRQISSRCATGKVTVGLESHWPRGTDRSAQPLCGWEGNRRS